MTDTVDFIGIGAAKCGTTWVARALAEHPQVRFAADKELDFFNSDHRTSVFENERVSNYALGRDWYLAQIPPRRPGTVRGEFSVTYLTDPLAPQRIADLFPDARLLAVLRNPVDMVYSLHWFCRAAITCDTPDNFNQAIRQGLYLDAGRYHKHLSRFAAYFRPEQMRIMLFDDIRERPDWLLGQLWRFLGVDDQFRPSVLDKQVNPSVAPRSPTVNRVLHGTLRSLRAVGLDGVRRAALRSKRLHEIVKMLTLRRSSYPPMSPQVRQMLIDEFRDDIDALEDMLERDLSAWKVSPHEEDASWP
ncbi:MAG: sulfotransferase domain-containing protein [Phycisphaerae bacterium]|nr:sulfotransferase domain-containing protein [Phycisphaerae bacterium]